MGELQKISQSSGLTLFNQGQTKAIDTRLRMAEMPEVMGALTPIDKQIFVASVRKPIAEFADEELINKVGTIAKYVTRDAGIKTFDEYDITRFMQVLKTYFPLYSLQEVRLAFELSMVGELDDYLPRDKEGNPDKSHYQSFNVEYITKILNAYRKRRRDTEANAFSALPNTEKKVSPEMIAFYCREWKRTVINSFLAYKYCGKVSEHLNLDRVYEELNQVGLAEPFEITESDKKEAVTRLLKKVHSGVIKEFIGECIRYQQTKHRDVIDEAQFVAKEKALFKTFDRMVREEIQITDYITLK